MISSSKSLIYLVKSCKYKKPKEMFQGSKFQVSSLNKILYDVLLNFSYQGEIIKNAWMNPLQISKKTAAVVTTKVSTSCYLCEFYTKEMATAEQNG